MNVKSILTMGIFLASLIFVAVGDADAARLGGGRSFGSKPSMQRSTQAPAQQQTPPMAAAAPAAAAQKPGLLGGMGGMGGMLGGLLAGSLLGSLLFGGGFSGGGFMDILLIGLLLFLGFKLFARFRAGRPATASGPDGPMPYASDPHRDQPMQRQNDAASLWGAISNKSSVQEAAPAAPVLPAGFDGEEFLRGAKMAFTRLQMSWDKRDLDDIAQFASDAVMHEIRAQFKDDPTPGTTEILLVNAQLLSVSGEANEQTATVFFDVLLREAPNTDTRQVREVWHFTRPVEGGSWKLDGIQQVE